LVCKETECRYTGGGDDWNFAQFQLEPVPYSVFLSSVGMLLQQNPAWLDIVLAYPGCTGMEYLPLKDLLLLLLLFE